MQTTPNLGLKKYETNDTADLTAIGQNWDRLDNLTPADIGAAAASDLAAHLAEKVHVPYAVASGSANTYSVTLSGITSYQEGLAVAVKINVDNTGASTLNINGLGAKAIKKPNGLDVSAGNLKAGSIYTMRYNGANFILQGSDAAGNATPGDVLSGKTFSNDSGEQIGTMPNRGAVVITPGTANQAIPAGYHNGAGYVVGDPDLVTGNIKAGANIFGVAGKTSVVDTADATAVAGDILSGKIAYVNGSKLTGTMPNRGAYNITPGTSNIAIPAGYHNGSGVVYGDPDLVANNIKSGVNIFGVVGTVLEHFFKGTIYSTSTASNPYVDDYTNLNVTGRGILLGIRTTTNEGYFHIEVDGIIPGQNPGATTLHFNMDTSRASLLIPFTSSLKIQSNLSTVYFDYVLE